MKKIPSYLSICSGLILLIASSAQGANLVDAYNQALKSDPTFKQAEATWLGSKAGVGIARFTLLPSINATGSWTEQYQHQEFYLGGGHNTANGWLRTFNYGLNLNQPIFNYKSWANIGVAEYAEKAAAASYNAAAQTLISTVITGYFTVLNNYNTLHYDIAQRNADYQQYVVNQKKYKVGLMAITPVYATQAAYDADVATVISDQNEVANSIETLSETTGKRYRALYDVAHTIPLTRPKPNRMNLWAAKSRQQNYSVVAARFTTLSDKEAIKAAFAGHLPTLSLTGTVAGFHNANDRRAAFLDNQVQAGVGLAASLPILSGGDAPGGSVIYNTKKARYQFVADSEALEVAQRSVVSASRQAFLSIGQDIAKIKADAEAIRSSSKALTTTEAAYHVGTHTIYDVLTAISKRIAAQKNFYADKYSYLQEIINLKLQAGTLNANDVKNINRLLTRQINFSIHQSATTPRASDVAYQHQATAANAGTHHARNGSHKRPPHLTSSDYSIQLYASHSLHAAQSFFHLQAHHRQLHLIKVQENEKTIFYKVTYGSYPSYTLAKRALTKLPREFSRYNPWIMHFKHGDENITPTSTAQQIKEKSAAAKATKVKQTPSSTSTSASSATAASTTAASSTTNTTRTSPAPTSGNRSEQVMTSPTTSQQTAPTAPSTSQQPSATQQPSSTQQQQPSARQQQSSTQQPSTVPQRSAPPSYHDQNQPQQPSQLQQPPRFHQQQPPRFHQQSSLQSQRPQTNVPPSSTAPRSSAMPRDNS